MNPEFFEESSSSSNNIPDPNTTTTHNRTFDFSFSETIIKSKQSKTSMKSLKLTKSSTTSVTTATSNINQRQVNSNNSNASSKKKLKSFIKTNDCNNEEEFKFLQVMLKFLKFIDDMLYYVVFFICQLPLLLIKLLIPLYNLIRKFFHWLRFQMKKPIKIPRFYPFRCCSPLVLVLDLDETLVHCTKEKPQFECEELTVLMKGGKFEKYYLSKRPYLEHFLEELSKFYTLVVFTSSQQEYADTILNRIDFKRCIKQRFYRQVSILYVYKLKNL